MKKNIFKYRINLTFLLGGLLFLGGNLYAMSCCENTNEAEQEQACCSTEPDGTNTCSENKDLYGDHKPNQDCNCYISQPESKPEALVLPSTSVTPNFTAVLLTSEQPYNSTSVKRSIEPIAPLKLSNKTYKLTEAYLN